MRRLKSPSIESGPRVDLLTISDGALGPIPACSLEIRPFTVLIGAQGTGKSLVAQLLYFFEELPFLVQWLLGTEAKAARWSPAEVMRFLLGRLRSTDRAFGVFANPRFRVDWKRGAPWELDGVAAKAKLGFRAYRLNRVLNASRADRAELEVLRTAAMKRGAHLKHHAIFFPTERIVASLLRSIGAVRAVRLPLTYELFDHWLFDHAVDEESARKDAYERAVERVLGGKAVRRGDNWKWKFAGGQFDLDMASSGQRANWSIPYVTRALRAEQDTGSVARQVTLFVEEPEIHLHPEAQVEVVRLLARMVRLGFRVVVTTHSLTVLYELNNLVQAGRLGPAKVRGLPDPEIRLATDFVSLLGFKSGAPPKPLVDRSTGFVSEQELGAVGDDLAAEYNRIAEELARPESSGG